MKLKSTIEKLLNKRNLLILLFLGIALMVFPDILGKNEQACEQPALQNERIDEKALEKILIKLDSVEKVDVFVTYNDNGNTNYAYDVTSDTDSQELKIKMSKDTPLVTHTDNPRINGILVVVQGKNLSTLELCNIVKAATGVPLHRICVVVSKGE